MELFPVFGINRSEIAPEIPWKELEDTTTGNHKRMYFSKQRNSCFYEYFIDQTIVTIGK